MYIEEQEAGSRPIEGVGTAVAAFLGFATQGPFNTPTLVSNWTQYTQIFGDFAADCYLGQAVYGYFLNGGGNAYIVRIGGNGQSDGAADASGPQAALGSYRVRGKALPPGTNVTVEITEPGGEDKPADRFNVKVSRDGRVVETFENLTFRRGKENVVKVIAEQSKTITLEETATVTTAPAAGTVQLVEPAAAPSLPAQVATDDYVGDVSDRSGVGGLESIEEITMVAVPDLMSAYNRGAVDLETVKAVQLSVIAHCEAMGNRVAILDPPPGMNAQQIKDWRVDFAGYDSKYATLYYPWIKVFDPASGSNEFVPPSGHVAGLWGRTDAARGVHKAPANDVVRGAVTLENTLTRTEQELLNPLGINCIRSFPGRGIRVWGARTLSSDPAWRYLNVRRLFNYLEDSILRGTQWVVFEPNDDALWSRIRRTISAFLVGEWRKGALFGLTPDEAFYVKCDRENNTAESIDAGMVICEIGVAPVKPAEFVIFRLSQFSGGTSEVSE
ncbi:tail protein [Actinorhabdospora filicis]|uniref:Tail protein n=1 Tax=Actinorhabdospora filicis TaxID=1785913 RepID=A0A9W6SQW5_9ACTN|nr:tail protein [Actinorhabdospora filicis]